jgi:hypothetical protein
VGPVARLSRCAGGSSFAAALTTRRSAILQSWRAESVGGSCIARRRAVTTPEDVLLQCCPGVLAIDVDALAQGQRRALLPRPDAAAVVRALLVAADLTAHISRELIDARAPHLNRLGAWPAPGMCIGVPRDRQTGECHAGHSFRPISRSH